MTMVSAKDGANEQEVSILSKADFNSDGIQDMLILSKEAVTSGSYSALRLFVLTKKSSSHNIQVIKQF